MSSIQVHCLSRSAKNKKKGDDEPHAMWRQQEIKQRALLVISMQCGGHKIKRRQRALCSVEAIGKKYNEFCSYLCVMWRQHEKKTTDFASCLDAMWR